MFDVIVARGGPGGLMLAAVELLVRPLGTHLARMGRSTYLVGSVLGLASTTYDLSVTSTLLDARVALPAVPRVHCRRHRGPGPSEADSNITRPRAGRTGRERLNRRSGPPQRTTEHTAG